MSDRSTGVNGNNDTEGKNGDGDPLRKSNGRRNKRPRSAGFQADSIRRDDQHPASPLHFSADSSDDVRPQSARRAGEAGGTPYSYHQLASLATTVGQESLTRLPHLGVSVTRTLDAAGNPSTRSAWATAFASEAAGKTTTAVGDGRKHAGANMTNNLQYPASEGFFEVVFMPTGALGITFEWAIDFTSWSAADFVVCSPPSARSPTAAVQIPPLREPPRKHDILPRLMDAGQTSEPLFSSPRDAASPSSDGSGANPTSIGMSDAETTPGVPQPSLAMQPSSLHDIPQESSLLPPLFPSSILPTVGSNKTLQYALRIQGFPALPCGDPIGTFPSASHSTSARQTIASDKDTVNDNVNAATRTQQRGRQPQHDDKRDPANTCEILEGDVVSNFDMIARAAGTEVLRQGESLNDRGGGGDFDNPKPRTSVM